MLRERIAWAWREAKAWSWIQWAIAGVATLTVGAFSRAIFENGYSAWVWGPVGVALLGLALCMLAIGRNADAIERRRRACSSADFLMLELADIRHGLSALCPRAELAFENKDNMTRWVDEVLRSLKRIETLSERDTCPGDVRAVLEFHSERPVGVSKSDGRKAAQWVAVVGLEIARIDRAVLLLANRYGLHPPRLS